MKQFERIARDIDSLAEFMATGGKGENKGCEGCNYKSECVGKETCKKAWVEYLESEVLPPFKSEII